MSAASGERRAGKGAAAPVPALGTQKPGERLARRTAFLTHRIAFHLDAVGVVNQPVESTVCGGSVADLLMPARNGKLRSQNR
jgi:hypothetical protein